MTYHAKESASKHSCNDALLATQTERLVSKSGQQLQQLRVQSIKHIGKKLVSVLLLVSTKSWYDFPYDKKKTFRGDCLPVRTAEIQSEQNLPELFGEKGIAHAQLFCSTRA